ncbi:unnamed protein product [Durusdinium trenchii]|uniref:Uncharacterized protein n=2 Tax=Durusdinium trenchii TaxID=1381693 RepID=A0ABP0J1Q2_9DINO
MASMAKYAASSGFLREKEVCRVAQLSRSHQECFEQGHFLLHLSCRTHQMSRLQKERTPREELLSRMARKLAGCVRNPLISLHIEESRALEELFEPVLKVLRGASQLQSLQLLNLATSPIRASMPCGRMELKHMHQLVDSCTSWSGGLTELSLAAGEWSWHALVHLFHSLAPGAGARVQSLKLRGKLPLGPRTQGLPNGQYVRVDAEDTSARLETALHVKDFCWRGARIHSAECLERLSRALPKATMVFKMEVCGVFAGPSSEEIAAFAQLRTWPRQVWTRPHAEWQLLAATNFEEADMLRVMQNLYLEPLNEAEVSAARPVDNANDLADFI